MADEGEQNEMVEDDTPQSQMDSWDSTNCNRPDGTPLTTFTFDCWKKSVSPSNQESNPNCQPATCELPQAWTSCRKKSDFCGKTMFDEILGPHKVEVGGQVRDSWPSRSRG